MATDILDGLQLSEVVNGSTSPNRGRSTKGRNELSPYPLSGVTEDMVYCYLTFDTVLNLPQSLEDEIPARNTLPRSPDLRNYASPFQWSSRRKTITLVISSILEQKWNLSPVVFNTGVTAWSLGFALSPMFLAALSELNGRRPVFAGSGIMMAVSILGCGVTDSFAGMLVARFFNGAGASTFATMVGGVVSDIYHTEGRNTPMAIYSGWALSGVGLGPLISGFITDNPDWRWVFYAQALVAGAAVALVIVFFKETRGSVLLSRKAKRLNEYFEKLEVAGFEVDRNAFDESSKCGEQILVRKTSDTTVRKFRFKTAGDEDRSSLGRLLYLSLTIPFHLLFTEPVVFFFSLWVAFAWAVLYMCFDMIPLVFATRGFTVSQIGAVFAAIVAGTIIGTFLSIYQEQVAKRYWKRHTTTPEGRLYFACVESALLPLGLFWFGWTSLPSIPWIVPALAIGCAQVGIFSIYLAVFNYLADVYHRYASSAIAGQSFCRNVLGAIFPLFTEAMFHRLGAPGAASLLGGIATLLTIVPWVLVFFGHRIRRRSPFASEIIVNGP